MKKYKKTNINYPSYSSEYHKEYYRLNRLSIRARQDEKSEWKIGAIKSIFTFNKNILFSFLGPEDRYIFIHYVDTNTYLLFSTERQDFLKIYSSPKQGYYYTITLKRYDKATICYVKDLIKSNPPLRKDYNVIREFFLELF
tara:strand:+ start:61 stop:483 length:423 start_codon:yes stop_codon:yes gene_type:complete